MIEITYTEILLFGLAGVAALAYLHAQAELTKAKVLIRHLLTDKELRDSMASDYAEHMKRLEETNEA